MFRSLLPKQKYCSDACEAEARANKHQGIKAEWLDLPKRRCKNCPAIFKPRQPTQEFCKPECRWEFHRYGGAYAKLRDKIGTAVREAIRLEVSCPQCDGTGQINKGARLGVVACEKCLNGKVLTPFGRDVLKLLASGHAVPW
jgi:hypothetical protein